MSVTAIDKADIQTDRKKLNEACNERKTWFRVVKKILRLFVREPKYIFLGDKAEAGSVILTNHVGPSAPMTNELYSDMPVRLWGAHEMNESFKSAYKYQTEIYYHQKKHWNLYLAKVLCLILITPLTYMYYRGINLISSYGDVRFRKTLTESLETLEKGHTVVIFPEKSDNGYFKVLTGFYPGAIMFLQYCKKNSLNPPVFVAYLNKETKQYIFDAPKTVDELLSLGLSRNELADMLCARCNELGTMTFQGA